MLVPREKRRATVARRGRSRLDRHVLDDVVGQEVVRQCYCVGIRWVSRGRQERGQVDGRDVRALLVEHQFVAPRSEVERRRCGLTEPGSAPILAGT